MSINVLVTSKMYDPVTGTCFAPFGRDVKLPNREIALITGTFYNSFFNVSSSYQNNTIVLQFPNWTGDDAYTMQSYVFMIPDGFYSIQELNSALHSFMIVNNLYLIESATGKYVYFIDILVNTNRYKTQIDMYYPPAQAMLGTLGFTTPAGATFINPKATGSCRLVCPTIQFQSKSGDIFGIENASAIPNSVVETVSPTWIPSPAFTHMSTGVPDVQRTKAVLIRCNMVNSPFSNPIDQIALIPLTAQFGGNNTYTVPMPMFMDVANASYNGVRLSFTDQDNEPLTFLDTDVSFSLQIREKDKNN